MRVVLLLNQRNVSAFQSSCDTANARSSLICIANWCDKKPDSTTAPSHLRRHIKPFPQSAPLVGASRHSPEPRRFKGRAMKRTRLIQWCTPLYDHWRQTSTNPSLAFNFCMSIGNSQAAGRWLPFERAWQICPPCVGRRTMDGAAEVCFTARDKDLRLKATSLLNQRPISRRYRCGSVVDLGSGTLRR